MKKILMLTIISMIGLPLFATNIDNPLYIPKKGEGVSRTSLGVMLKRTDNSTALKKLNHNNKVEFPIYKATENILYSLEDNLYFQGNLGYLYNGDIDRKGANLGRLGFGYRLFDTKNDNFIFDLYSDFNLGGVHRMSGTYSLKGFKYDNYTNGQYGVALGSKIGKEFSNVSLFAFAEVLYLFQSSNNRVNVNLKPLVPADIPNISVVLKPKTEYNAGFSLFYDITDTIGTLVSFKYSHHEDNKVANIVSVNKNTIPALTPLYNEIMDKLSNVKDGFDEYIINISFNKQLTDRFQVGLYGEYVFDTAHEYSQNGTDLRAEAGIKMNVKF